MRLTRTCPEPHDDDGSETTETFDESATRGSSNTSSPTAEVDAIAAAAPPAPSPQHPSASEGDTILPDQVSDYGAPVTPVTIAPVAAVPAPPGPVARVAGCGYAAARPLRIVPPPVPAPPAAEPAPPPVGAGAESSSAPNKKSRRSRP